MNRVAALLSAAGIDPRQGSAEAAALMVRRFPMRIGGRDQGAAEDIVECGWCSGLGALGELMTLVTSSPRRWGMAFGVRWPWFEVGGALVAPGLPVRLAAGKEEPGPDGIYTLEGDVVYREAAGRREVFLEIGVNAPLTTPEFTLLWFSDTARFLIRNSVLEVEDLFSKTCSPIDRSRLDHILIRGHRVDEEVIEGLSFDPGLQPTTIEVARERGVATAPLQGPSSFLKNRIDVEEVTLQGDRTVIKDVRGESVEFLATLHASGWLLERKVGQFPFEKLSLQEIDSSLVLKATLAPEQDLFSPGLRGRVVFDLNADLTIFQKL